MKKVLKLFVVFSMCLSQLFFAVLYSNVSAIKDDDQIVAEVDQDDTEKDTTSETTQEFYKNVQNKLHFAITGMTAPEIIYNRVDSKKENMGLTTWKNAPDGKILETDVTIAKNYLSQEEIAELNNLVSMYLDYAERQVKLGKIISMKEWKEKLEVFLKINEYNILKDNGKIKREIADKLALDEYKKYRVIQDQNYISDFDELVIETKKLNNK